MAKKYYSEIWRVEVNYLSVDYEDRALFTSSPYKTLEEAEEAYNRACGEKCVDVKTEPARVELLHFTWKSRNDKGTSETLKNNYKEEAAA